VGAVDPLAETCRLLFANEGRLARAIPGFVGRTSQTQLAIAIANTIIDRSVLVAEAGTGTGKTFAYLVPCLLSGKKVLISTATKTLQDQLFLKDLPTLVNALGLPVRIQNLKGRANYLCKHRIALYAEEGQFHSPTIAHEILHVRNKEAQIKEGERSELPEISEDSPVWHYVTSTTENCLGKECSHYDTCFLVKARKRALDADVVVVNHHLFFADSRLKQDGFGELLPGVDIVIFDEAHQLAEIATQFHGERVGTKQFKDLLDDMLREWPILDIANQPLKKIKVTADKILDKLALALPASEEKISWFNVVTNHAFMNAWNEWLTLIETLLSCCFNEATASEYPGLVRLKARLEEISRILSEFVQKAPNKIMWLERFKQSLLFHATPHDVADAFSQMIKSQDCAFVFTSATLTMASSFNCFCKPLGLLNVETLSLPSPFDYQNNALLYLPRGLPDPKDPNYYDCLLHKAIAVIEAFKGRCFFLFTSHKALKQVAQMMVNKVHYPLLIQGEEAKPILLARFRQLGNAVLLGTSTFWEGVDVKGAALSCVIIDKIPFANPYDPIILGKAAYLKEKGLSGFEEISLPGAVLALKQGVGRLIRDIHDKGVLMIADPRLSGREYGRHIIASLPQLSITRDELKVLEFIKKIEADNDETVSD
jgi:ATP-dependent DNA helicase DinG